MTKSSPSIMTLTTYCQIDGEDFVNFCGLLGKHELEIGIAPSIRTHCYKVLCLLCCQGASGAYREI